MNWEWLPPSVQRCGVNVTASGLSLLELLYADDFFRAHFTSTQRQRGWSPTPLPGDKAVDVG